MQKDSSYLHESCEISIENFQSNRCFPVKNHSLGELVIHSSTNNSMYKYLQDVDPSHTQHLTTRIDYVNDSGLDSVSNLVVASDVRILRKLWSNVLDICC